MTFAQVLKQKKELALKIKRENNLLLKNKALGLVKITNKSLLQKLYFGLANLPMNFIIIGDFDKNGIDEQFKNLYVCEKFDENNLGAFDFVVLDSTDTDLQKYSKNAIVSISPKDNQYSSILKEYNPMKNEGNAYLYDDFNGWSIFWALARYLENFKITFDNKNLVKNVFEGK